MVVRICLIVTVHGDPSSVCATGGILFGNLENFSYSLMLKLVYFLLFGKFDTTDGSFSFNKVASHFFFILSEQKCRARVFFIMFLVKTFFSNLKENVHTW